MHVNEADSKRAPVRQGERLVNTRTKGLGRRDGPTQRGGVGETTEYRGLCEEPGEDSRKFRGGHAQSKDQGETGTFKQEVGGKEFRLQSGKYVRGTAASFMNPPRYKTTDPSEEGIGQGKSPGLWKMRKR